MDGWYVTMSWGGYGVILTHDWILHLVPYFRGDGKIAPKI